MGKKKIVKKELNIRGKLSRREIRDRVAAKFLDEPPAKGWDEEYRYYVEELSDGRKMFLKRPTGFKKGFLDFKIEAEKNGKKWEFKGKHKEICEDLIQKSKENPKDFKKLYQAVKQVWRIDNVNQVVASCEQLKFDSGFDIEFLLKLLKWMFILEDVDYWSYKGRVRLMEYIDEKIKQKTLN